MSVPSSKQIWVFCSVFLFFTGLFYYPKWKLERTEATIAWDVSGYYWYLPAFLIYNDAKRQEFRTDVLEKYHPTPELQQSFLHPQGNYVMRYSAGMALQYLPFFAIADIWARNSKQKYPPDGFSRPYQSAIHFGSILVACIGLWVARKVLLRFYRDETTALVLLCMVLASNYLDYTAINGAMAHNYLFLWYGVLLVLTMRFYESPDRKRALLIGLVIGLMALTRPTEVLSALIPVLWGVGYNVTLRERLKFLWQRKDLPAAAVIGVLAVGSIQLLYWWWAAGDPLIYSYQDKGFNFLSPKFGKGLLSYRSGWLTYSPVWVIGLLGFFYLKRYVPQAFTAVWVFTLAFMYVAWSWEEWWYGGALGQRAMVQAYALLALPMGAFIESIRASETRRQYTLLGFLLFCAWYNLYWTHQAHKGGLLKAGQMTRAYFWKVVGRYDVSPEAQFYLDSDDWYEGVVRDPERVFQSKFEGRAGGESCGIPVIQGEKSLCIHAGYPGDTIDLPFPEGDYRWLRGWATFRIDQREWNVWNSTLFSLRVMNDTLPLRQKDIRIARIMEHQDTRRVWIDLKLPRRKEYDRLQILFSHRGSPHPVLVDELVVEVF